MLLVQLVSTLLAVSMTARADFHVSAPIQADIIFPLNNTVYNTSLFPFPLIFQISNSTSQWNDSAFDIQWSLQSIPRTDAFDLGSSYSHAGWSVLDDPPSDELYTFIMWDDIIDAHSFMLEIEFGPPGVCSWNDPPAKPHTIYFNVSGDGVTPNLSDPNYCSEPIAAIAPTPYQNVTACPTLSNSSTLTPLVKCAMHGSPGLFKNTTRQVSWGLRLGWHKNATFDFTWPDGVLKSYDSIRKISMGHRLPQAPLGATALALVVGWLVFFI